MRYPYCINYLNKFLFFFVFVIFISGSSCVKNKAENFHLGESTVIIFSFKNVKDSIKFSMHNLSIFRASEFSEKTFITPSESKKNFVLPCFNPALVNIFIGNNRYTAYTIPSDTLRVSVHISDSSQVQKISFEGNTKPVCDFFLAKQRDLGYQDLRYPLGQASNNPDNILHNTDSLFVLELNYLKNYPNKSELPDWFIQTERNQIIYLCNVFKEDKEMLETIYRKNSFKPSSEYYRSFDTLKIDNSEAKFSYYYHFFLNIHLVYKDLNLGKLSTKERMNLTTKTALKKASRNITGEIKDVFEYKFLSAYLNWTKNLSDYDQLYSRYEKDFTGKIFLNDLIKTREALTDSIVKNRDDEYHSRSNNKIKKNDSIPYFYLPDNKGEFYSSNKFKDKLIYINFWSTSCKPCIESIPVKNELIEKFKDEKNIVFLNVCISSEKENWKKLLNQKEIKGINLFANKNWSHIIKKNFNISGVPTYFLIKNGKIVNPFCDSPKNIEDDIRISLD